MFIIRITLSIYQIYFVCFNLPKNTTGFSGFYALSYHYIPFSSIYYYRNPTLNLLNLYFKLNLMPAGPIYLNTKSGYCKSLFCLSVAPIDRKYNITANNEIVTLILLSTILVALFNNYLNYFLP